MPQGDLLGLGVASGEDLQVFSNGAACALAQLFGTGVANLSEQT